MSIAPDWSVPSRLAPDLRVLGLMKGSMNLEHMAFRSLSVVMLHALMSFFESFIFAIILPSRGKVSLISFFFLSCRVLKNRAFRVLVRSSLMKILCLSSV